MWVHRRDFEQIPGRPGGRGVLGDRHALYGAFTSWAEGTGASSTPIREEALVEIWRATT